MGKTAIINKTQTKAAILNKPKIKTIKRKKPITGKGYTLYPESCLQMPEVADSTLHTIAYHHFTTLLECH